MSDSAVRANERVKGPVLTSEFLVVLDHDGGGGKWVGRTIEAIDKIEKGGKKRGKAEGVG